MRRRDEKDQESSWHTKGETAGTLKWQEMPTASTENNYNVVAM